MAKFLILIPSYNDWQALALLLELIEDFLSYNRLNSDIVMIDDGSTLPLDETLFYKEWHGINSIQVLKLRRNLGHQRAIAHFFSKP